MKRSIKIALIAFAAIIVIVIGTIITMNILNDENKLTVDEKKWIQCIVQYDDKILERIDTCEMMTTGGFNIKREAVHIKNMYCVGESVNDK